MSFTRRILGTVVLVAFGACTSPYVADLEARTDALFARLPLEPAPEGVLDWSRLLAHAQDNGPLFLAADLTAIRSETALDERRSGARPRLSLVLRSRLATQARSLDLTGTGSTAISFEYDLANALLGLDDETIALTSQLIAERARIARREAQVALMDAYVAHARQKLQLALAQNTIDGQRCQATEVETQVRLGRIGQVALDQITERIATSRAAYAITADQVGVAAEKLLRSAGYASGGRVSSQTGTLPRISVENLSTAQCYANSGAQRRDALLQDLARAALKEAEVSRFTQFSAVLPTQISSASGLNFDLLLNWVIPLIDQGSVDRRILDARLNLLAIALQARAEIQRTGDLLSGAQAEFAASQLELSQMDLTAQTQAPVAGTGHRDTCQRNITRQRAQLERKLAELSLAQNAARLAIFCSAGD